jgi:hypothetical protein
VYVFCALSLIREYKSLVVFYNKDVSGEKRFYGFDYFRFFVGIGEFFQNLNDRFYRKLGIYLI